MTEEQHKRSVKWLMDSLLRYSNQYQEAELLLDEIAEMPLWKLLFCRKKIIRHLNEQLKKYEYE